MGAWSGFISSHTTPPWALFYEPDKRLKPNETQRHCPAPVWTDLAIRFPKAKGNWVYVKIAELNQLLLKQYCVFREDQGTVLCQRLKQIKLFSINHWPGENQLFMLYYTLRGIKIFCIIYNTCTHYTRNCLQSSISPKGGICNIRE